MGCEALDIGLLGPDGARRLPAGLRRAIVVSRPVKEGRGVSTKLGGQGRINHGRHSSLTVGRLRRAAGVSLASGPAVVSLTAQRAFADSADVAASAGAEAGLYARGHTDQP
jgi:hypothetical protein